MTIAAWLFAALLSLAGTVFIYLGLSGGMSGLRLLLLGRSVLLYIHTNEYVEGGTPGQAPIYEVVGGEFAGNRAISKHSAHPPLHTPGDVVEGRCDPEQGIAESYKTLWRQLWINGMLLLLGLVPMVLALMILF
ncbi:MAG: hypothetical protein AAF441_29155 [Pseudomonadota bacterium]